MNRAFHLAVWEVLARRGRPTSSLPQRASATGFTLVEMLVVIGIVTLLATVVVGTIEAVRDTADRAMCAAQVRRIGQTMLAYANMHRGLLPDTGAASSLAGRVPDDGFHFSDAWNSRGTSVWPHERRTGNAGNLYLLIRIGLLTPDDFICPASGDRAAFGPFHDGRFGFLATKRGSVSLTSKEKEFLRLNATRHCSYSYQNMLGHGRGDPSVAEPEAARIRIDASPEDLAILADHNPYTQLRGEGRDGLAPNAEPLANSLNHGGDGQNVFYLSGSVAWHATPLCGAVLDDGTRDNIYRPARGSVLDPRNIPRHARDSYLVP